MKRDIEGTDCPPNRGCGIAG